MQKSSQNRVAFWLCNYCLLDRNHLKNPHDDQRQKCQHYQEMRLFTLNFKERSKFLNADIILILCKRENFIQKIFIFEKR